MFIRDNMRVCLEDRAINGINWIHSYLLFLLFSDHLGRWVSSDLYCIPWYYRGNILEPI